MMKSKIDLSFYDFVGVLVPGITFLYCIHLILARVYNLVLLDFAKIGDSVVFIVLAYVTTQVVLHPIGNFFEKLYWRVWKGMPTSWLTKSSVEGFRGRRQLFRHNHQEKRERIIAKITATFKRTNNDDYGMTVYRYLEQKNLSKRADIFNANHSLFRGLNAAFFLLSSISCFYHEWFIAGIIFILLVFSFYRMDKFAVRYAEEIFDCFFVHNLEAQEASNLIPASKQ